MFLTDFIFRQPETSDWIQATLQQNTNMRRKDATKTKLRKNATQ